LVLVVGHYQFDSVSKIRFAPMVFASSITGVISYWSVAMQRFQTHHIIDRIIELDERHVGVARDLLATMIEDDPELARTWLDLAADASKDGIDPQGLFILPENVFHALHSHIRYGYVIEWLAKWSVESFHLKTELAGRLPGGWDEADTVLSAEHSRRTG
jgi:hypothetical protein